MYSTFDKFMGFIPGSVGETSTFLILIGAAILIFTKIGSWRIILSAFIGAAVMGLIFNQVVAADIITESTVVSPVMFGWVRLRCSVYGY